MIRPVFGPWPDPSDRATFETRTVYNLPLLEDFGDWLEFMAAEVDADKNAAAQSATTAADKVTDCQAEVGNCEAQVALATDRVAECQAKVEICEDQVTLAAVAKALAETARDKSSEWASKPAASGTVDDGVNTPDLSAKAYAVDDLKGSAGGSAKDWARADEDIEVSSGEFSAKHWAEKSAKGERLTATSATSIEIGTGSKVFTLAEQYRAFIAGSPVRISSSAAPATNYMEGVVTGYDSGTDALTISVASVGGSGTHADWSIGLRASGDADTLEGNTLAQVRSGVSKSDVGLGNVPNEDATDPANWDLAKTDGGFVVGNGSTFVIETAATARTSIGAIAATNYATSTAGGTVKCRLNGTTAYFTTDGSDA